MRFGKGGLGVEGLQGSQTPLGCRRCGPRRPRSTRMWLLGEPTSVLIPTPAPTPRQRRSHHQRYAVDLVGSEHRFRCSYNGENNRPQTFLILTSLGQAPPPGTPQIAAVFSRRYRLRHGRHMRAGKRTRLIRELLNVLFEAEQCLLGCAYIPEDISPGCGCVRQSPAVLSNSVEDFFHAIYYDGYKHIGYDIGRDDHKADEARIHRSKLDGAGCRAGGEFGGCAGVRQAVPGAGRSEEPSLSAARGR